MADKIIKLSRRYEVPGEQPFDSVTLREPTYQDIFMSGLGRPVEWQPSKASQLVRVVYPEVIDSYAERLVKEPGYSQISGLDACDALAIGEAICGFFRQKTE